MSTSINLGEMEPLVAKAILDSLSEETRRQIITDALTHLMTTPPRSGSYAPGSPMQEIFNTALRTVAANVATEVIESDERFTTAVRSSVVSFIEGLEENSWDTEITEAAVRAIVAKLRAKAREVL